MDDEELWELARKPVTEFIEAIKQMNLNVDRLVKFYLKHKSCDSSKVISESAPSQTKSHDDVAAGSDKLSPLGCAKLELAIVFAINTCYWMYLTTHGEDPRKNEISKDIERVRLFMNRAKEVEESMFGSKSSLKRPKIDKEASKRLCKNALSA